MSHKALVSSAQFQGEFNAISGFHEERAILLGRLGRHEQALAIYIHLLNDGSLAEEWVCCLVCLCPSSSFSFTAFSSTFSSFISYFFSSFFFIPIFLFPFLFFLFFLPFFLTPLVFLLLFLLFLLLSGSSLIILHAYMYQLCAVWKSVLSLLFVFPSTLWERQKLMRGCLSVQVLWHTLWRGKGWK